MPMLPILQVVALVLIAVGFGLSLSHALELPGKLRLSRDTYIAVQSIYYPGFTIGGVFGEFGAILAVLVTLVFTPSGSTAFLPTFAALIALLALHAIYWIVTHPVNKSGSQTRSWEARAPPSSGPHPSRLATGREAKRIGRACATAGNTPTWPVPVVRSSRSLRWLQRSPSRASSRMPSVPRAYGPAARRSQ